MTGRSVIGPTGAGRSGNVGACNPRPPDALRVRPPRRRTAIRPAEPGRNALLDAGRVVLAAQGIAGLTINAVVAQAGMAKGSFYTHFADRAAFIFELYRAFYDAQVLVYVEATTGLTAGAERLRVGMDAFLDGCHGRPDAMVLLGEARFASGLEDAVAEQSTEIGRLVIEDLTAIGWPDPLATALLLAGAGSEVAMAEARTGTTRPELRAAFHALAAGRPPSASRPRRTRSRTGGNAH
jgi:TetR/AcrR family transcriptional repressor of nem operon